MFERCLKISKNLGFYLLGQYYTFSVFIDRDNQTQAADLSPGLARTAENARNLLVRFKPS